VRFLLEESVDFRLLDYLRSQGDDALAVSRDFPSALADADVLRIALRESRILVTNDRDFGELVFKGRHQHAGVVFIRIGSTGLDQLLARVGFVLERYADRLSEFVVVTPRRVRVRQVP
jgi:predicted nuclease of predicted toxin-antitoxin system